MLTLRRRHHSKCPHRRRGWNYSLCNCTIWVYGTAEDGSRVRKSLRTTDRLKALEIINPAGVPEPGPTAEPIDEYVVCESIRRIEVSRSEGGGRPYVYFIDNREAVKIGIAIDVGARLSQLQTDNPEELRLRRVVRGGADLESWLHVTLSAYRVRGEWFRLNPTIEAVIAQSERFCCIPALFAADRQALLDSAVSTLRFSGGLP